MKKPGALAALLTPDAHGWRVRLPGGQFQSGKTLQEAVAALPASQVIHLALPCNATLIERVKLPSTDREELAGMLQLQLEKTLPYPVEEVSSGFEVISQVENESTLVSVAANNAHLDRLCEPLRLQARLPEKVTVYAMHVAASCPPDQVSLCVWPEDGLLVVAVCEGVKLSFAHTLSGMDAPTVLAELPAFLLSAEMDGVPTDFAGIRIEQGCAGLRDHLVEFFNKPVEIISFDTPLPEASTDLVPSAWIEERRRHAQSGVLKQRLQIAAALYLVLIAGAFIYLAWLKSQVRKLDVVIAQTEPQVELAQEQEAQWRLLAPAVDPQRYAVELLHLLYNSRPSDEVKFTMVKIDAAPTQQWQVEGETPPMQWDQFTSKLREEPGLKTFKRIDTPPIKMRPDGDMAQFVVFGKL